MFPHFRLLHWTQSGDIVVSLDWSMECCLRLAGVTQMIGSLHVAKISHVIGHLNSWINGYCI